MVKGIGLVYGKVEWRGTQADYIRIESQDYFNRYYDEYDMEETHVRDTYGRNSERFLLELANLITTDGDLAGALTYSLVSDSEEEDEVWEADASWTGDADERAEGRVKYHSTLDSTGHERMRSETGDWITLYDGQEDREATFERIATAARAFDSETGEMIAGEFTWTGDAHVQLFGTDLSETEWTPNELEEALNTIFTEDSTGYPEPPEDDGDGSEESELRCQVPNWLFRVSGGRGGPAASRIRYVTPLSRL